MKFNHGSGKSNNTKHRLGIKRAVKMLSNPILTPLLLLFISLSLLFLSLSHISPKISSPFFLSFSMDPVMAPAIEKCTQGMSVPLSSRTLNDKSKKYQNEEALLEVAVITDDDTLFHLSLQAGKPEWFCPDVGVEEKM
jgi:hypothetical protein